MAGWAATSAVLERRSLFEKQAQSLSFEFLDDKLLVGNQCTMEHLIHPTELENLKGAIFDTRWLEFDHDETKEYPLVAFEDYPLQRGWSRNQVKSLRLGSYKDTNPTDALAMIQSWLFFGLLESIFQQRFHSSQFLTTTGSRGHRSLNSAYFRLFYQRWLLEFPDLAEEVKRSLAVSVSRSLTISHEWALFLVVKLGPRTLEYQTPPLSTALSATVLNAGLIIDLFNKVTPRDLDSAQFKLSLPVDIGHQIYERMGQRKWCPSDTRALIQKHGLSVAVYASLLESLDDSSVIHDKCDRKNCLAYNVDISTYQPKHQNIDCTCKMISPPVQDIYDCLQNGNFPLIDGSNFLKEGSEPTLLVTPHELDTEFVAFSHVWSDGLGSVTERGLPHCQLRFLSKVAQLASGSTLFWIDSLCIPMDPTTRTCAIHQMSSTYSNASVTVVLDAVIRKCSIKRPLEEIVVRILSSTWMRRIWTLQEGLLAKNLIFFLEDYLLRRDELLSNIFQNGISGAITATGVIELVAFSLKSYVAKPANLAHLLHLLSYRTSSRLDDETIAISPLLHIDVKRLTPYSGERRAVEFWKCLKTIPAEIIFLNGDRITTWGYRWAPRRLVWAGGAFGSHQGTVTEKGLIARLMILHPDNQLEFIAKKRYHLVDTVAKKSFILFDYPDDSDQPQSPVVLEACDAIAIRQQPTGELMQGKAILLVRDPHADDGENIKGYQMIKQCVIIADEFAETITWDDLPQDLIIVRSKLEEIRIS